MRIYLQTQNFKENTIEKLIKAEVYTQQITKCTIHNPPRSLIQVSLNAGDFDPFSLPKSP